MAGEIGLDTGPHYAHASLETQHQTFREVLEIVADMPRIVSIHSYRATEPVIRDCDERQLPCQYFTGGQVLWMKCEKPLHLGVTFLYIQP